MGRSIHDGSFSGLGGIRSGRRLDQQGPFSSSYGGAGDMDAGTGRSYVGPGMREPRRNDPAGGDAPTAPTFPSPRPPTVTAGDTGTPRDGREAADEATKALADTAAGTQATAEAVAALGPPAKEAADGAKKTADAAAELQAPVKEIGTGLTSVVEGLGAVKAEVAQAVTGVGQVVKAVNDLKAEMAKLKAALDQLGKAA
jgi:hypothetical protein